MEEIYIKVIIYIVIMFAIYSIMFLSHEIAHREINYLYGIKSKIKTNFINWHTETENITIKQKERVLLAHAINEVFGYPLLIFSILVCSLLLWGVLF